jgi:hypothetical protein
MTRSRHSSKLNAPLAAPAALHSRMAPAGSVYCGPINSRLRIASANSPPSNAATSEEDTVVNHGLSDSGSSSVQRSTGDSVAVAVPFLNSRVPNGFSDAVVSAPVLTSNVRFVAIRPRESATGSSGS